MSKLQSKSAIEQLQALQQGDEQALNYFFDKYYPSLVFYSRSFTGETGVAEEIAADAYIKLWDRHDRFFAENSLRSFLYMVVRNASLNHKRDSKRTIVATEDYTLIADDIQSNDLELLITTETYHEIYLAITSLPKRYQNIFQQFYFEGKSYAEIAASLDTTINNIRIQKMRAILLLRKKLPFSIIVLLVFQLFRNS